MLETPAKKAEKSRLPADRRAMKEAITSLQEQIKTRVTAVENVCHEGVGRFEGDAELDDRGLREGERYLLGVGDDLGNLGQTSSTYQSVDTHTQLAWLADRFPLIVFPGVASVGDMLIALGIIWIFAALTRASSVSAGVEASVSPMAA